MVTKVNNSNTTINIPNKKSAEAQETKVQTNLFHNNIQIHQIIPLQKSAKQQLDIGIVYTEEFGIRGVIVKDDVVHIMPVDNIVSSLNNQDKGENLVKRIATRPYAWDLVYDATKDIITVWPKMQAAGRLGEFTTIGVTSSSNQRATKHVERAFNGMRDSVGGPLDKREPNGLKVLSSFSGSVAVTILDKPITVYRTTTGEPSYTGNYWSTTPPKNPTQYALENAIHPSFNKAPAPGDHVTTATIPAGTVIYHGTVSEQRGFQGGAQQIWLTNQDTARITNQQTVPLKEFINNHNNNGGGGGNNGSSGGQGQGGGSGGSSGGFNNDTNQNGLTESYNSSNPSNPLANAEAAQGEIGGVAVGAPNAQVVDLLKPRSLYDLEVRGYWLAFPISDSGAVFSAQELQQICREMAQNVFIHNTLPFYSLHFTKTGALYSVIHPAYQNTLVGKVISQLDYIMKGYLNGAYFSESDLQTFARFGLDEKQLKDRMLLIEDEYKRANIEGEYTSLSQLIEMYQIKQYNVLDSAMGEKIQQKFQVSFRIIAKQDSVAKAGSTILFNGGFDVFYTIEPHIGVVGSIEQYQQSQEYQILDHFCKHVANDIKLNLPKLGICKQYFMMLDVICGLSYYYSSLKEQELVPKFTPVKALSDNNLNYLAA